jgi:hypothetical protein
VAHAARVVLSTRRRTELSIFWTTSEDTRCVRGVSTMGVRSVLATVLMAAVVVQVRPHVRPGSLNAIHSPSARLLLHTQSSAESSNTRVSLEPVQARLAQSSSRP